MKVSLVRRAFRKFIRVMGLSDPYRKWRKQYLLQKKLIFNEICPRGVISFTTTIWNTKRSYLEALLESLIEAKNQGGHFEWVILDNGSTAEGTRRFLKSLSKSGLDIKLLRVEKNIGIIRGNRQCLEAATGMYICPIDSDDIVAPHTLSALYKTIKKHREPALMFSDEDKVFNKDFCESYFKPNWDPVLFLNSCYIAHLCAIKRDLALQLGVYSDDNVNGSHDWDTFCRFYAAGYCPVHIPEVLYSWRMHRQSTSSNIASKDYIFSSQKNVLQRYLSLKKKDREVSVLPSPFFPNSPNWWLKASEAQVIDKNYCLLLIKVKNNLRGRGDISSFFQSSRCLASAEIDLHSSPVESLLKLSRHGVPVVIAFSDIRPLREDWWEEFISVRLLHEDVGLVGGRFVNSDTVVSAPYYFGLEAGPDKGRSISDPGFFAQMWKRRSVDLIPSHFFVVTCEVLQHYCHESAKVRTAALLGIDLSLVCRKLQRRVVYSPHFYFEVPQSFEDYLDAKGLTCLQKALGFQHQSEFYSPHLRKKAPFYTVDSM